MTPSKSRTSTDIPRAARDEPTSPARVPAELPVEPPELEIRRCLRQAIVLLAATDATPEQRLKLLSVANHWVRTALKGIDRLARDAELGTALPDTQVGRAPPKLGISSYVPLPERTTDSDDEDTTASDLAQRDTAGV